MKEKRLPSDIPALTRILEANATPKDRINLLKEQIKELQAQKKCYDKMILQRKMVIWKLKRIEKSRK